MFQHTDTSGDTPRAIGPATASLPDWLTALGVELRTGVEVSGIAAPRTVHLSDGTTLAPDMILAAVGIAGGADALDCPDLQMHEGRIVVDQHLAAAPGVCRRRGDVAGGCTTGGDVGRGKDVPHSICVTGCRVRSAR